MSERMNRTRMDCPEMEGWSLPRIEWTGTDILMSSCRPSEGVSFSESLATEKKGDLPVPRALERIYRAMAKSVSILAEMDWKVLAFGLQLRTMNAFCDAADPVSCVERMADFDECGWASAAIGAAIGARRRITPFPCDDRVVLIDDKGGFGSLEAVELFSRECFSTHLSLDLLDAIHEANEAAKGEWGRWGTCNGLGPMSVAYHLMRDASIDDSIRRFREIAECFRESRAQRAPAPIHTWNGGIPRILVVRAAVFIELLPGVVAPLRCTGIDLGMTGSHEMDRMVRAIRRIDAVISRDIPRVAATPREIVPFLTSMLYSATDPARLATGGDPAWKYLERMADHYEQFGAQLANFPAGDVQADEAPVRAVGWASPDAPPDAPNQALIFLPFGTRPGAPPDVPARAEEIAQAVGRDAIDAAYRTAGRQIVKLARDPLVGLLSRHLALGDDALRGRIAAFLETETGSAALAALLSAGLSALPQGGEVQQRLARELRVSSMAGAGDALADVLMEPMRQAVALYLQDPATPEDPRVVSELGDGARIMAEGAKSREPAAR